jgi:AAA domain
MEHLSEEHRRELRTAIAAGRVPNHTKKRTILATGAGDAPNRRKYRVLADHRGLTPHGRAYYEETGQEPPDRRVDRTQRVTRQGNSEYVRDRQGRLVRLRTLRANGDFQYTRAGRSFFSTTQIEYIVHVPVIIEGTRRNGVNYRHVSYLPVEELGMGAIMVNGALNERERNARVRTLVLNHLGLRTQGGRTVLLEVSGETYLYDRDREWLVDEMVTQPTDHGPRVNVRIRQVMAGPIVASAFIPFSEHVIPEAWEQHDDKLCVIRQLAVLTGMSHTDLCDEFDRLLDRPWREDGITTDEVLYFCKDKNLPYYCVVGGRLQEAWVPAEPKGKSVAFCCFNGHMYAYRSARCVSDWTVTEEETTRVRLRGETRSVLPSIADWELWDHVARPGVFHTDDLGFARKKLLGSGRSPRVVMRSLHEMGGLVYKCVEAVDGCKGDCIIRETPPYFDEIGRWLENMGNPVEWCGERLPAITWKVLRSLLDASRRCPHSSEKEEILRRQSGRCATCGGIFDDDVEWDHVAALKTLMKGQTQVFQALCSSCHAEKTQLEGASARSIESRFSPRVWELYVKSPKVPPLVWQPYEAVGDTKIELDVVRCRRNALAYSQHPWSVFNALDSVVPAVEGVLGDFTFVGSVRDRRRSKLNALPFVGPGWYHRISCQFLLHHGICSWGDFLWSLTSLAKLPADVFKGPLEAMETAWEDKALAKMSVNSCVGTWCIKNESISVLSTNDEADVKPGSHMLRKFAYDDKVLNDHIYLTRNLDNASMRSIHDQVLATEATRVAELLYIVKSLGVPQKCVTDVKTDCLNLRGFAQKHKRKLEAIGDIHYSDLTTLRRRFEKVGGSQKQIDCFLDLPACENEARVFRWDDEPKSLQGQYREPVMEAAEPMAMGGWTDLAESAAKAHALAGGSLVCLGAPGVGKSTWVREIVRHLRQTHRVDVVSRCHASCQNFGEGALTIDHWVRKNVRAGRCSAKTIVVEEISQVPAFLWNDLAKAALTGCQWILLGDFAQLDPCLDTFCGAVVPEGALQRSDLLKELSGGFRLELTHNHRSDADLFGFFTGLGVATDTPRDLQEAVMDAKLRFPRQKGFPQITLVIAHSRRMALNRLQNLAEKPADAVLYKAKAGKKGENAAQHMFVYPGQRLIGAGGRVRKGVFVTVKSATLDELVLEDETVLTSEMASRCLRLSHCITIASAQGLTLLGRVRVETNHPTFTLKHLYVASSRCTAANLLEVV